MTCSICELDWDKIQILGENQGDLDRVFADDFFVSWISKI